MEIEIVYHYPKEDGLCEGDYYDVEMFIDGKLARTYTDYYHDKPNYKIQGFVDALKFMGQTPNVKESYIADRDC